MPSSLIEVLTKYRSYVPPRTNWAPNPSTSPVHGYEPAPLSRSPQHGRSNSGGNYYEDVEPRFADRQERQAGPLPPALMPGGKFAFSDV